MRVRNTVEASLEAFAAFLFRCLLLGIILQEAGWTVEVDARCMQVLWRKARESPCQQWAPTASHPGYSSLLLHQGEESIINLQNCVIHGLVFQAIAFNGTWLLQIDYMKRSMCSVYGLIYFWSNWHDSTVQGYLGEENLSWENAFIKLDYRQV